MDKIDYLHIGRTAGTSFRLICESNQILKSKIIINDHSKNILNVANTNYILFCVRNPANRFISAFSHRKLKLKRQSKSVETLKNYWNKKEISALSCYQNINELLSDLFSENNTYKKKAIYNIANIMHLGNYGSYWNWFINEKCLEKNKKKIYYVMRQEYFSDDVKYLSNKLNAGKVKIVKARSSNYGEDQNIESAFYEKLIGFLVKEFQFIDKVKRLNLLSDNYIENEIKIAFSYNNRLNHYFYMNKFHPLSYSSIKLIHQVKNSIKLLLS